MDSLRVRKTDKIDAEKLAKSQLVHNRKPTYVQEEVYQHLRDLSRFYQNMTEDLVRAKNRLHKVLQVTFPELENLLSTPTGEQYWNLVMAFPCKEFVLSLSQSDLYEIIRQSTSKRISEKRIAYLTDKLIKLAKQSFCAVKKTSPMLEEVRYYAQELLRLSERRQVVLNDMVALALSLYQSMTSYGQFLASQKPQPHLSLANWEIFVAFSLPIKSTLLLVLISNTMNREIS